MFFTYILYSETKDRFYIGSTENLDKRIDYHNEGRVKSTKHGTPWRIVFQEKHLSRADAMLREKQIKAWKSRIMIQKLIESQI